jgi:hypothetical protein
MLTTTEVLFIQENSAQNPVELALRFKKKPEMDLPKLVKQIQARQKLKDKLPTWIAHPRVYFPASISLEQSSSELAAQFKAQLIKGKINSPKKKGDWIFGLFLNINQLNIFYVYFIFYYYYFNMLVNST